MKTVPIHTSLPPLEFKSAEDRLLEEIRKRAPDFGFLNLRLEFKDRRLLDLIFVNGEERVRLG